MQALAPTLVAPLAFATLAIGVPVAAQNPLSHGDWSNTEDVYLSGINLHRVQGSCSLIQEDTGIEETAQ